MFADWWLALSDLAKFGVAVWGVSILTVPIVWLIRRRFPAFDVTTAQKKVLGAFAVAFIGGFLATPGEWGEKVLGGVLACVGSKFTYDILRDMGGSLGARADAEEVALLADEEDAHKPL